MCGGGGVGGVGGGGAGGAARRALIVSLDGCHTGLMLGALCLRLAAACGLAWGWPVGGHLPHDNLYADRPLHDRRMTAAPPPPTPPRRPAPPRPHRAQGILIIYCGTPGLYVAATVLAALLIRWAQGSPACCMRTAQLSLCSLSAVVLT